MMKTEDMLHGRHIRSQRGRADMSDGFTMERVHLPVTGDTWLDMLRTPVSKRPAFFLDKEKKSLVIGQVIASFLGVSDDEEEYYRRLLKYVQDEKTGLRFLSAAILDRAAAEREDERNRIVRLIKKYSEDGSKIAFIDQLKKERLLVSFHSSFLANQVHLALEKVLDRLEKEEQGGLTQPETWQIISKIIHWSRQFLEEFAGINPEEDNPKFLWYGDYKKEHAHFVCFLIEIGSDLLVFSPSGENILSGCHFSGPLFVHRFGQMKKPRSFPDWGPLRKPTVAYRAAKEIESMLSGGGTVIYKRWQLRDYTPASVTLKTTYDELFLLLKEPAMVRPGFEVGDGVVKIPSLFSKIQGMSKNRKEYWDRMHSVILAENTLLIREFPFSRNIDSDLRFHYRKILDGDGLIDPEKLMRSRIWKYKRLPTSLQRGIAAAICRLCAIPALKPDFRENLHHLQVYLFTHVMQLPKEMIKLLQNFDYPREVPKIVIFNNGLNGVITRPDACALLLLNQIGVDILVYNPAGLNDIENYIDEDLYDTHWLDDVVPEQEFKEPSFLRKLYYQGRSRLQNWRLDK